MAKILSMPAGAPAAVLLSPLGSLPESNVQWVQDTYIKGVGSSGNFNPNYGTVSFSGDIATVTQAGGISVGFVTKCEANKNYRINFTLTGNGSQSLRVMYFNGASRVSYDDLAAGNRAFTTPSGITDVVLAPFQNDNGNMVFAISEFKEM